MENEPVNKPNNFETLADDSKHNSRDNKFYKDPHINPVSVLESEISDDEFLDIENKLEPNIEENVCNKREPSKNPFDQESEENVVKNDNIRETNARSDVQQVDLSAKSGNILSKKIVSHKKGRAPQPPAQNSINKNSIDDQCKETCI